MIKKYFWVILLFGILLLLFVFPRDEKVDMKREVLFTPTVGFVDYPDTLVISKSGTLNNPIIYNGFGQTVKCVSITGSNIILINFVVSDCTGHGIYVNSQNVTIANNVVIHAESDRLNSDKTGCSGSGGWGSGIKVHVGGENIIIRGNRVYENCGEGIGVTRGVNVLVENNVVYDNYSINIYIDNSNFVEVRDNQSYCTGIFLRNGYRPSGIAIAEEEYAGWGVQRHDNQVLNNTVKDCFQGISSWDSELDNGREIRLLIEGNMVTNCIGSINCIKLDEVNEDVIIRNNCVTNPEQRIWVRYPSGVTLENNICGVQTLTPTSNIPTTIVPSVTSTSTSTVTITRTKTPTVTSTRTSTMTPSLTPTVSKTFTPTVVVTNEVPTCVLITWDKLLNVRHSPSMFNAPYNVNISSNAIIPVENVFDNSEGKWAQINKWMYFAMYLNSNNNTYAIQVSCE